MKQRMATKLSAKRKKFNAVMESLNFILQQRDERFDKIDEATKSKQIRHYLADRKTLTQALQDALTADGELGVDRRTIYSQFDFLEGKSFMKRVTYEGEVIMPPDNDTFYELNYFKIKQAVNPTTLETDCTPTLLNTVKPAGAFGSIGNNQHSLSSHNQASTSAV
jgi:hypothetical protein